MGRGGIEPDVGTTEQQYLWQHRRQKCSWKLIYKKYIASLFHHPFHHHFIFDKDFKEINAACQV